MKVWAAYRITGHGLPIYPEFIFRVKHTLERYLEDTNPRKDWEKYTIKEFNLDVPKLGSSERELRKSEMIAGNIKEIGVVFKTKDGLLHRLSGKEAIETLKKLK